MNPNYWRYFDNYPAKVLGLALAYFIVGRLSLLLAIPPAYASPVWAASGFALAGVLLGGYRYLPAVFLGSLATNIVISFDVSGEITTSRPIILATIISVGAMLQTWISAVLIKRVVDLPCTFEEEKDIGLVMFLGGPIGCIVNTTLSCSAMYLMNVFTADYFLVNWFTWWAGDMIGVILFTPILLLAATKTIALSRKIAVTLPLMVLLSAITSSFLYARENETDNMIANFHKIASYEFERIEKKLHIYEEVLRLTEDFFNSSQYVDRDEFKLFSNNILSRHSEIYAMGWVPAVKQEEQEALIATAHQQGETSYTIRESVIIKEGSPLPSNASSEIFPIFYVEPSRPNKDLLGQNLATSPVFYQTLQDAKQSAKEIGTRPIFFMENGRRKSSFYIFNPVYNVSASLESISSRSSQLQGFVFGIFMINDLIDSVVRNPEGQMTYIHVYDNYIRGNESVIYGIPDTHAPFLHKLALEVGGRQWTFEFTPSELFLKNRTWYSWNVIVGGLLFASLLQAFLLIMTAKAETIKREVRLRTAELEDSETKHRAVVDNATEGFVTIDAHGIIQSFNRASENIFGYQAEEVIGQNIRILMPEPDRSKHDSYLRNYQNSGEAKILGRGREVKAIRKDGTIFPIDLAVSEISMSGNIFYSGIIRDITERKASERQLEEYTKQLKEAKERAEQLTEIKSEFLANMSHEIRTPMNGILGMTNLLLNTELTNQQKNYANIVIKSADALLEIINDILDLSKIEAGKLDLELIPFDLRALAEDAIEIVSFKCSDRDIDILLNYPLDVPHKVIGDPGRIRQIILNLLSNAVKFTEHGHILLDIKTSGIITHNDQIEFVIAVEDTGIGIAESKLEHIFNKFDQADQSTTRKFGGTGLGLAISKQLTQLMNGEISVDSEIGKGSKFWFSIPLTIDEEEQKNQPSPVSLENMHILLAGTHETSNQIVKSLLESCSAQVTVITSGKDALRELELSITSAPIQMVIINAKLSDMKPEKLCTDIKQHPVLPTVATVLIGDSPLHDENSLKAAGIDGYISNPMRPSELPAIIQLAYQSAQTSQGEVLVTRHSMQADSGDSLNKLSPSQATILLVEDNRINLMVATAMLENVGCHVVAAQDGAEAILFFKEKGADLIFMDCQMPEMDGYEATHIIRTIEKERQLKPVPIIAFTANAMREDREKCLESGMNDYIPKPVSPRTLQDMLQKWLSGE